MDPIIELQNVNAGYDNQTVLADVSLKIYKQDFLGIVGPNGGGKTTLVKVLLKQIKPTKGSITFYKDEDKTEKLNIGYLPQYNLIDKKFPISVYEVILSGLDQKKLWGRRYTPQDHEQVKNIISKIELEGLENKTIGELSGGQLQRALLGRAIVSDPEVVILDEPNTYVDKRFEKKLYNILAEINYRCSIIIISHELESLIDHSKNIAYVDHSLTYHNGPDRTYDWIRNYFE